ncbi:MAG: hypothetical protein SXQ77_11060 [Halobacteria archaeon]|nr:hypothetical protein [Halobacteria archaeon]
MTGKKPNKNRRKVLKKLGVTGVSTVGFIGQTSAKPQTSKNSRDVKKRIRSVDEEKLFSELKQEYGKKEAKIAVRLRRGYANKVLNDRLTHKEAFRKYVARLKRHPQIENITADIQQTIAKRSNTHVSNTIKPPASYNTGSFSTNQLMANSVSGIVGGDSGGSGWAGFQDSRTFPDFSQMEATAEIYGAGDVQAWAELWGEYYHTDPDQTLDVSLQYFREGEEIGGNVTYKIFVDDVYDGTRVDEIVETPSGYTKGTVTSTIQHSFDQNTLYNIGLRLKCGASGLAAASADYFYGVFKAQVDSINVY